MNCFYHREITAVGVCRACGRALCPQCASESEPQLACKGRCEAEVKRISAGMSLTERMIPVVSVLIILLGLWFAVTAYDPAERTLNLLNLLTGVCVIGAGLYFLFSQKRARKNAPR